MNNEDKRQMTVIAAEIERQNINLSSFEKDKKQNPNGAIDFDYAIKSTRDIIKVLESLLPKEREMIVKSHEAGQAYAIGSHKDFKQTHPNAEEYYSQFKPYDK